MGIGKQLLAVALGLAPIVVSTPVALAADTVDTVLLSNGGRVRGTVQEADPVKGVRVRLVDGTVKSIRAADVKSVSYAGEAPVSLSGTPDSPAPAPTPAPAPAPAPAPTPAPAPAAAPSTPPATSPTAPADNAGPTGFELGARTGYAIPLGDIVGGSGDNSLSNLYSGVVPIWIDAGYRFSPNMMIGAFFQYGIGFINTSKTGCSQSGVSCSANDMMFGAQLHYHLQPDQTIDPWAGVGVGYEIENFSATFPGGSGGVSLNGFQFLNLQLGADYKAMPNLGIGPFIMLSLGQYGSCSPSGNATCSIPQTAMHEWFTIGVRGAYDIAM